MVKTLSGSTNLKLSQTLTVGNNSFIANATQVTVAVPVSANGGTGTAGQVLTTNGSTGSPYWSTINNTINVANAVSDRFTANGNQNTFNLSANISFPNNAIVTLDGLVQSPNIHYTIVNNSVIFSSNPTSNTVVEIRNLEGMIISVGGSNTSTYLISPIKTVNTNYVIEINDSVILSNSSSDVTLTLPLASTITGKSFEIKNINTGAVNIVGTGGQTIDGYANLVIQYKNSMLGVRSIGTSWMVY